MKINKLLVSSMFLFGINTYAVEPFSVEVVTEKAEPIYQVGEEATFEIRLTDANGELIADGSEVIIEFSNEFNTPFSTVTRNSNSEPIKISEKLDAPGFLRCKATVTRASKSASDANMAGFSPDEIQAAQHMPEDFISFWSEAKAKALELPLDPQLELIPELSTDKANYYKISIANINNSRIYGYITIPKAEGKYPIMFTVPGAGPGYSSVPLEFDTDKVIMMTLNVHAHEVESATMEERYAELNKEQLYMYHGLDSRENYYYYRTILGLCRGVKYLSELPQWDGEHFVMYGSSQGGAMTFATSALNGDIITAAALNVPAFCDYEAAQRGGSPGWPVSVNHDIMNDSAKMAILSYYDSVNFAQMLTCPIIVCIGMVDSICPPGTIMGAVNGITSPKSVWLSPKMGHDFDPAFTEYRLNWMKGKMGLAEDIEPTNK